MAAALLGGLRAQWLPRALLAAWAGLGLTTGRAHSPFPWEEETGWWVAWCILDSPKCHLALQGLINSASAFWGPPAFLGAHEPDLSLSLG